MAPNKLEDRIREQLQEREIQPSKEAWSKMEARLGTASAPRSNKKVWYAIAAAFAGLAVLATFFFSDTNTTTEVVEEDSKTQIESVRSQE